MNKSKKQRHVISVSIGSSERDHSVETDIMGVPFKIERIGTDGDIDKAIDMIKNLDGKVDAFGLGGIDLYVYTGNKRFAFRDALRIANAAKVTPVYDGGILKNSIEKEIIFQLARDGRYLSKNSKVLLVTGIDRYGMAEALCEVGCDVRFGDFLFSLNLPIIMKKMASLNFAGRSLLPIVTNLPFEIIYPTGKKQRTRAPRYENHFQWADVIAGDFLYIYKYMPENMTGKVIITNTTTAANVEALKKAGVSTLVTTTPELEGRSFGTNTMEGVYATILGKTRENPPTIQDFLVLFRRSGMEPRISVLNP